MTDGNDDILSTDNDILDSIGEGDDSSSGEDDKDASTATAQDVIDAAQGKDDKQGADGGNGKDKAGGKATGPQDLIGRDGQVIARSGSERRFYETAIREKQRAGEFEAKFNTVTSQMEAIKAAGNVGTQYGLTPEEVGSGAKLMSAYKENPLGTIRYLLTQAQAAGHNVEDIAAGGLDAKAVKEMFDNALAPLVEANQARVDTQAVQVAGEKAYNEFLTRHPDAFVHQDTLAQLLASDPNLSPEAAFYKLQAFFSAKGLDWAKPLSDHQAAINPKAGEGKDGGTQVQLPGSGTNASTELGSARVADVNVSLDTIIRDAMEEHGIKD